MTQVTASHSVHCGRYVVPRYVVAPPPAATAALASLRLSFLLRYSADRYLRFLAARTTSLTRGFWATQREALLKRSVRLF